VSLELGGSNDATNLWPEVPPSPNPKDQVEDTLHDAVCAGQVSLAAAQNAIASDWMTAEARLGLGRPTPVAPGSPAGASTPPAASSRKPPPATGGGCYPRSDEGTCYRPGEYAVTRITASPAGPPTANRSSAVTTADGGGNRPDRLLPGPGGAAARLPADAGRRGMAGKPSGLLLTPRPRASTAPPGAAQHRAPGNWRNLRRMPVPGQPAQLTLITRRVREGAR